MDRATIDKLECSEELEAVRARLDWVPDWIWEIDLNAVITYSNRIVTPMLGYTPEEVIGRTMLDLVAEPDVAICAAIMEHAIATGEPVRNVFTHLRGKTRKVKSVEVSCVHLFDSASKLIGFRGITRDLTDMMSAERMAQETEANYRVLVENSQTGIFIVQNGMLAYVNPRICELMGYDRDEVIGTPIMRYVHPEDAVWLGTYEQRRLSGEKVPTRYVARGLTKAGEIRYFDFSSSIIGFGGEPAVLLNAVDITESMNTQAALRKSKEEYRDLVEHISDWVWQIDADMRYTYASPKIRDLLGYAPEEVLGKRFTDLMPGYFVEWLDENYTAISEHQPFTLLENPMVHRDGSIVWVETSGEPVFDEQGGFRGYRGIDRNVTERKRAEEALRASEEQYKTLFDSSPLPMWVFCMDSLTLLAVNEAMLAHYGYARDELLGKSVMMIGDPEDAERVREDVKRALAEGHGPRGIWSNRKKDGTPIDVEITTHTLTWKGNPAMMVLANDVTERLQAEEKLRKATSEMETVLQAFPDLYFWIDAKDRIINYHAADSSQLYAAPGAFLGKTFTEVLPTDVGRRLAEASAAVRRSRLQVSVEYSLPAEDQEHYYEARLLPLTGEEVIVIVRNITERHLHLSAIADSEERYRHLFEHSPDMVMLLSAQSNEFIAVNPTVSQLLGYSPREILGKTPWDMSPEFQPDGERSVDKARALLRGQLGAPPQLFEWMHQRKDGSLVECEVSLVYYRLHGQDLVQAIVRDITERKHAEEARRRMESELDRQKRSFYRETILSVTDGKLNIVEQHDVESYVARSVASVEVNEFSEVAAARRFVDEFVMEHGITGDRQDSFLVGVGEAVTNAVKHGRQGRVYIGSDDEEVWVAVADRGAGIESLILPRAVLLRGFSTKPSLGLGYSIMLEVSDRILLSTGDQGTTVILIKSIAEPDVRLLPEFLPDTWDNVPG